MKLTLERFFNNVNSICLGEGYAFYEDILRGLIYQMRDKLDHPFVGDCLKFVMNRSFYLTFSTACERSGHVSDMYRGIPIILDSKLGISYAQSLEGIVRLIYEEPRELEFNPYRRYCIDDATKPHIDHVKFNGPATIVFWKDGTKTVVKHDGKGRKDKRLAILYAFIRKIYGEGKPYHNILNEIEEAVK